MLLLELMAKKPKTRSRAAVVVTDGATMDEPKRVNAPLCESMGADTSMPLASMIAPVADADAAKFHV